MKEKNWFLGLVYTTSPMGRLDYLVCNIVVGILYGVFTFFLGFGVTYVLVRYFNADLTSIKIVLYPIVYLLYIYLHYNLMTRRLWHITEEKSKAMTTAVILSVLYLIPIIKIPVILVAELIMLFKSGCDIPEEDQY